MILANDQQLLFMFLNLRNATTRESADVKVRKGDHEQPYGVATSELNSQGFTDPFVW